jgi:UDP-N-acetylglucosamine 3-dehydrogenase
MRIGILGAGWTGSVHARAYSQMTDVEIAGIVGRREPKVKEQADSLGVPGLTDPWKLLDDDTVDAIDVCYPTYIHRDYVVAALQRGKHVFCETPIALSLQEVDAMIAAARSSGKLALVALVMRFVDTYVYVHDAVKSGELGKPLVAYAYRAGPRWPGRLSADFGELVIEPMIHDFDYLNWLLGKPAAVSATGHFGPTGEVDHAFVSLEYDGVCGQVEGSHLVPASYPFTTRLRVVCEEGAVETSYRFVGDGPPENILTHYPKAGSPEALDIPNQDPYLAECRYFADCVSGKADPALLHVETARDGLQAALAAKESLQRGGERVILT